MGKKLILKIIVLMIFLTVVVMADVEIGYDDDKDSPKIKIIPPVAAINYSIRNVNSSDFWDNLDVPLDSWIDIYNETYDSYGAFAQDIYVNITGDTMTGDLNISSSNLTVGEDATIYGDVGVGVLAGTGGVNFIVRGPTIESKFRLDTNQYTLGGDRGRVQIFFSENRGNTRATWTADYKYGQITFSVTDDVGMQWILTQYPTTNHSHGIRTTPTLYIHSNNSPAITPDEWISFTHNITDGIIEVGSGEIFYNTNLSAEYYLGDGSQLTNIGTYNSTYALFNSTFNLTYDSTYNLTYESTFNSTYALFNSTFNSTYNTYLTQDNATILNAANITSGTFGDGNYIFPANLTVGAGGNFKITPGRISYAPDIYWDVGLQIADTIFQTFAPNDYWGYKNLSNQFFWIIGGAEIMGIYASSVAFNQPIEPWTDGSHSVGSGSYRWHGLYLYPTDTPPTPANGAVYIDASEGRMNDYYYGGWRGHAYLGDLGAQKNVIEVLEKDVSLSTYNSIDVNNFDMKFDIISDGIEDGKYKVYFTYEFYEKDISSIGEVKLIKVKEQDSFTLTAYQKVIRKDRNETDFTAYEPVTLTALNYDKVYFTSDGTITSKNLNEEIQSRLNDYERHRRKFLDGMQSKPITQELNNFIGVK